MKHLSDTFLMEYLYDDFSSESQAVSLQHLAKCERCRERLARYRAVAGLLTEHPVDTHARPSERQLTDRHPNSAAASPRRNRRWNVPQAIWAAAAAVVLLATVGGFGAGAAWQARLTERAVARQWAERERVQQQTERQLALTNERWDRELKEVTGKLASLQASQDRLQSSTLPNWEAVLTRLIESQALLRKELETLAVSAESEIALTKRNIRNLEQWGQLVFGPALE